jgi:hypothetical protein
VVLGGIAREAAGEGAPHTRGLADTAGAVNGREGGQVAFAANQDGARAAVGADHVAVLLLAQMARGSRLWGFSRIVRRDGPLRAEPGLCFAKVLGSGHEGGFGLQPSASHQGVFAVFDGQAAAEAFLDRSPLVDAYRRHSRELCTLMLRAWSSRGTWSGHTLNATVPRPGTADPGAPPADAPVAALTRASIRPSRAARFWAMAPPAQASLAQAQGCRLAAGLGEAPLLRQATFSLWDSVAAMDAYARTGAHLAAIRASAEGGFFSESMFVRFVPLRLHGRWLGRDHG